MPPSPAKPKSGRLPVSVARAFHKVIRENRRKQPFRLLAEYSTKYLREYYNENHWDMANNGEAFALSIFAQQQQSDDLVIWDVGANNGGWASEATRIFPKASIHSFEIVPDIADKFEQRHGSNRQLTLHRFGLSAAAAIVDVTYNTEDSSTSSITYRATDQFGTRMKAVPCEVRTVDIAIESGIPAPVLLKIDTEGHDFSVMRGATKLLHGPDAPLMIQFEYGDTWLPAKETLEECQRFLTEAGYMVGRLYPNHVEFKDYEYRDDHYRMGNMIAVRDSHLRDLLSGK